MSEYPQQYSCSATLVSSCVGGSAGVVHSFGFLSSFVRIENFGPGEVQLNFQNAAATTAGFCLSACQAAFTVLELAAPIRLAGIGLATTTSATSTAAAMLQRVSVIASA